MSEPSGSNGAHNTKDTKEERTKTEHAKTERTKADRAKAGLTKLDVTGMHCASCVARVEKALAAVPGVTHASVDLLSQRAEIAHVDSGPSAETLVEAVRTAGYDAHVRERALPEHHAAHVRGTPSEGQLGARFTYTFAAAWVAMLLSAPLMHAEASRVPDLMHAAMRPVDAIARLVPGLESASPSLLRWILFALTLPILLWSGRHFFDRTWRGLRHGYLDMDSLVAIGTGTAFVASAIVTIAPDRVRAWGLPADVWYEAIPWVVSLVTLGRLLEERAKRRAGEAVRALAARAPSTARVLRDGREVDVPIEVVALGDRVVLRPGEKVAVDGVVETGRTAIDESMLTGEAIPVEKSQGGLVAAGTVNGNGAITYRATAVGEHTTLARIVRLLEAAMAAKPAVQRLADQVAAVFVPAVLAAALAALVVWIALGHGVAFGLHVFVTILIIACPCAMGLAVPAAVAVATGRAAALGILVRNAAVLETAHRVNVVVLDKTGTLTEGRPEVVEATFAPDAGLAEGEVLALAAALERRSEHPLAGAIVRFAETRGARDVTAETVFAQPGGGVLGRADGKRVRVGTAAFLVEQGAELAGLSAAVRSIEERGATPVCVAVEGRALAALAVRDPLRKDAREAVSALRAMGLRVLLLSGDRKASAEAAAREVGIDEVIAEASPEEKIARVRRLREEGAVVAMAGDGVNDAAALAAADLSIAMGSGTDVALEAADVALIGGRLTSLPAVIRLARSAIGIIRQNLAWAFGYNALGIPLAAGVFYPWTGWLLSPVFASAAMALSSVSVVTNSLRLRGFR
ncbi:MAG: heavy metal translocating P-type ATPase [bacterium]